MEFFAWLQDSTFSTWIRESDSILAYDFFLTSHALGMAAIVGLSAALAIRVLGFASELPLAPMERLFPFMYGGFWVNAASGLVLFVAYPVRAVTNPGFFVKIAGIVLAVVTLRRLKRLLFARPDASMATTASAAAKILAGSLLFFWWGAILAGRLMAYHDIANVERQASFAVIIASAVMLLVGYVGSRIWEVGKRAPIRS